MNEIEWNKQTLKRVKNFPNDIKREIGYLIFKLQIGEYLKMPFSRPIPILGKNCHELRIKGKDDTYRAFYFLKIKKKIILFHAFQKKSQKTPQKEIETGKKNLKEMLNEKNSD